MIAWGTKQKQPFNCGIFLVVLVSLFLWAVVAYLGLVIYRVTR
jgi:hypothetical protein